MLPIQNKPIDKNEKAKKPYFPLKGPEIVRLLAEALWEKLSKNERLSSDMIGFPRAQLNFRFELVQSGGTAKPIVVQDSILIQNVDTIPPDATRALHDLPILIEQLAKDSPISGTVDVAKLADEIAPGKKKATEERFGKEDPFSLAAPVEGAKVGGLSNDKTK